MGGDERHWAATMTDGELLQAYASGRSEAAFGELVRRHAPAVLAAAERAAPAGLADDVVQAVFLALSAKAAAVDSRHLSGWLYRAAGHAARHAARTAARRRRHESRAARPEVRPVTIDPEPAPERVAALHDALARLSDADRGSVLHRFARGQSFAAVGRELGVSEEAARKRVERAVGKLRRLMGGPAAAVEGLLLVGLTRPVSDGLARHLAAGGPAHPPAVTAAVRAALRGVRRAKLLATAGASAALAASVAVVGWAGLGRTRPPPPTVQASPAVQPTTRPVPGRATPQTSTVAATPPASPPAEPPLAGGPIDTVVLLNREGIGNLASTTLLNAGRQLARVGGNLSDDVRHHHTGTTFLGVYGVPGGDRLMACSVGGFPVQQAAFDGDGRRAVFGTIDWDQTGHNRLAVVDLAEGGRNTPVPLEVGPNWFGVLAITADGRRAAAAQTSTHQVDLWDLDARRKTGTLDAGTPTGVMAFDPAGRQLLVGPMVFNSDPTVGLWDVATAKPLARCVGHTGYVTAMAFAPDGTVAATADSDGAIWLWSMPGGRGLARLECPWETIEKLAFSPDGKRLVAAADTAVADSRDKPWIRRVRLRLWDVATAAPLVRFEFKGSPVDAVTFGPDGRTVVTDQGGTLSAWQPPADLAAPAAARAGPPTQPTDGEVARFAFAGGASVAFSADGRTVTAGGASHVQSWDVATGRAARPFAASNCVELIRPDLDLCVDDSYDAAVPGHERGLAVLYRLSDGRELRRIGPPDFPYLNGDSGERGFDLSPDGKLLVLSGGRMQGRVSPVFTPRLEVFHTADGTSAYRVGGQVASVHAVGFSPDGKRLYVASGWQDGDAARDCAVRVLAADTGADVATFAGPSGIPKALALSGDGRRLWVLTEAGAVDGWDTATGRAAAHVDALGQPYAIAASPDGRTVAVGMADHNVVLIDAATGTVRRVLRRHQGSVMAVAFSPDSARLASVGSDHTVRVWVLRAGR